MKAVDLTGQRFGRLVALSDAGRRSGHRLWTAACDCGNRVVVSANLLRKGQTQSCGCLRREVTATTKLKHGAQRKGESHRIYSIWAGMLTRCTNPKAANYKKYGGRGISVCDRWRSDYAAFERDMGPRPTPKHTLDRIDNSGNYEPGNCRWATAVEQNNNRRPRTRKGA